MKNCRHCDQSKPESAFYPSSRNKCKECVQSYQRAHRARNADRQAAYWREYRFQNPEKISAIQKRHYAANKERWDQKQIVRADRKQSAQSVPYKRESIFERDEFRCRICDEPIDMELKHPDRWSPTLDHRVPLCMGGADSPGNVQAAHLICNQRKGAAADAHPVEGSS